MTEGRFKKGDKVRVVRILPAGAKGMPNDDLSEKGQATLESYIGKVFIIKSLTSNDISTLYEVTAGIFETFFERELDFA